MNISKTNLTIIAAIIALFIYHREQFNKGMINILIAEKILTERRQKEDENKRWEESWQDACFIYIYGNTTSKEVNRQMENCDDAQMIDMLFESSTVDTSKEPIAFGEKPTRFKNANFADSTIAIERK